MFSLFMFKYETTERVLKNEKLTKIETEVEMPIIFMSIKKATVPRISETLLETIDATSFSEISLCNFFPVLELFITLFSHKKFLPEVNQS